MGQSLLFLALVAWLSLAVLAGVAMLLWITFCKWIEKYPPVTIDDTTKKCLLRCDCKALYWSDDQKALGKHKGHHHRYATEGTHWEMFKVKQGWI
jgi:hypothetical protein